MIAIIGFSAVGVEVVVGIGVVFQQDGGIFLLCHIQVGFVFRFTHDKSLRAVDCSGAFRRIAVDGDHKKKKAKNNLTIVSYIFHSKNKNINSLNKYHSLFYYFKEKIF